MEAEENIMEKNTEDGNKMVGASTKALKVWHGQTIAVVKLDNEDDQILTAKKGGGGNFFIPLPILLLNKNKKRNARFFIHFAVCPKKIAVIGISSSKIEF